MEWLLHDLMHSVVLLFFMACRCLYFEHEIAPATESVLLHCMTLLNDIFALHRADESNVSSCWSMSCKCLFFLQCDDMCLAMFICCLLQMQIFWLNWCRRKVSNHSQFQIISRKSVCDFETSQLLVSTE